MSHGILYLIFIIILITTLFILEFNHLKLKKSTNKLIKDLKKKVYVLEYFKKEDSANFSDILDYFNSLENSKSNSFIIKPLIKKVFLSVVVSFLLLFSIFHMILPSHDNIIDIYTENYNPLSDVSFNLRGENTNKDLIQFQIGVDYYLSGEYNKADDIFKTELKQNISPELLLYSALNKMAINDFYSAITLFNKLLYYSDKYSIEAKWYLSLCYIKTNQIQKAKNIISVLSEIEGIYKEKSKKILKKLQ